MKLSALLKSVLVLGVLVCWAGTASAQYDLDVKNASSCSFKVKFVNDDGTGTCTTCGNVGGSGPGTFNTFSCGATSGAVYVAGVWDGVNPSVVVGDCSLTSCGCSGLPASTTYSTVCGVVNVDYYPPGMITPNAFVYIY